MIAAGEKPPEPRGLHCPDCHCRHSYVLYTRPRKGGKLLRRRECRHCKRRFTTHEQIAGS